jgi:hypothetical protein
MSDPAKKVEETAEAQVDLSFLFTESATEETKAKVRDMFLAAVEAEATKIHEAAEAKIDEAVEAKLVEAVETLDEQVADYMDYAVANWVETNELAIESSVKVEMAESLLEGLKTLFTEHNIEVPEDADSVVETLVAQNEALRSDLNEALKSIKSLQNAAEANVLEAVLDSACEGMIDTKAAKLRELAENVRYSDVDDFREKVESFKKSLFTETTSVNTDPTDGGSLNEDAAPKKANVDPMVQAIIERVTKRF